MLLIGQPKSASTSLMRTIAEVAKIPFQNGQNRRIGQVNCEGFEETQKYHGTTVKRSFDYINNHINRRKLIYKEHILPVKEHLEILDQAKNNFVVLIREPAGVVNAYKRVFDVLKEMRNINYDLLYKEARLFYDSYRNYDNKRSMIVTFKDLILNFKVTFEKILVHYEVEFNPKKEFKLLKYNFTGQGVKEL